MARGNSNIKNYSPITDNYDVDISENANMIQCILDTYNRPEPDLHNPDEVNIAIKAYFENCISKGLKPGNLGLYNALGIDKKQCYDLLHGLTPRKANPRSVELIKKACKSLSEYRELLGSENKLPVPTLIFWQKNFDGLEDVQRMEVTANNAPEADKTAEEIAAQIEQDIPVDAEYNEV